MNLYLLRHGLAAERPPGKHGSSDADRRLTGEGKRKLRDIALAMAAMELCFDVVLSSPYVRARQTAAMITKGLKARKRLELTEALAPGAEPEAIIDQIKCLTPLPESVLLVGHEPGLSELISLLVSGRADLAVVMKKGGLCKLSIETLEAGRCASLEWLLTPGQMRLMS